MVYTIESIFLLVVREVKLELILGSSGGGATYICINKMTKAALLTYYTYQRL